METVSAMKIRQQLGELLNRLRLRGEEFIIEQRGKPAAVLLPYAKVHRQRESAWESALKVLADASVKGTNRDLAEKSLNELVNEAVHKTRP